MFLQLPLHTLKLFRPSYIIQWTVWPNKWLISHRYDVFKIICCHTIWVEIKLFAKTKESSTCFTITVTIIIMTTTSVTSINEAMYFYRDEHFIKHVFICRVIWICLYNNFILKIIHCYVLLFKLYVYVILTCIFWNYLFISATLACNVGLFQRTCLLIHPAVVTPDLVQPSLCLRLSTYAYFRCFIFMLCVIRCPFLSNWNRILIINSGIKLFIRCSRFWNYDFHLYFALSLYIYNIKHDNTKFKTYRIKIAYMQTRTLWRYRAKITYAKHVSWA